ncbi:ribonuclease domain-containing protein [Alienimonas californiensis]|uniref:Guanyl-specific ribonuclease St n=1 Tax=Alienimonas californiensis TaxID=2527989 RepID=A0A517PAV6_9PLAN|nr:ribonuclease domain-containing protein [Alienimonas californiensis]QDT16515.1 Guanyl-specific ribonuclease St [Alienimonas californiensis]
MSQDRKPPAASPATLEAIRHLARLGVRGGALLVLLAGIVYLADRYLLDDPAPGPGGGPQVAGPADDFGGADDPAQAPLPGDPRDEGLLSPRPDRPAPSEVEVDFGPDPDGLRRTSPAPAPESRTVSEPSGRTYEVVTVSFRTPAGEATVDLEPGAVLSRTDSGGLTLAERLRGGEQVKTNCGDPATVASAEARRTAEVRPPPRCVPLAIDPAVEQVTVLDFDRPVPAAAPGGVVDLSKTLQRIARGESFPHRNDGTTFGNREGRLPRQSRGYYKEYVHPTPGVDGPGPQRLVIGAGGDVWYTPDHYDSFRSVVK